MCAICGCAGETHDHDHHHEHGDHSHEHRHEHVHEHALETAILGKNDRLAAKMRALFAERSVLALNLVSSPGAGKTTLLERTIVDLSGQQRIQVIEGDQATSNDAERIRAAGAEAIQINTGTGCHLDAAMVERAVERLAPEPTSLLFIENVGNLVCPALFDLGERAKVLVASVTEGEDKPLKYPHMFRASRLVLLNKIDLLPHLRFDVELFIHNAKRVSPGLEVIPISALAGHGVDDWYAWVRSRDGRA